MAKHIHPTNVLYWGKGSFNHNAVVDRGNLTLYWGKREAPKVSIRGGEIIFETDSQISIQLESKAGWVKVGSLGTYSWVSDGEVTTLKDLKGRELKIDPQGILEEQALNDQEAKRIAAERDKVAKKERAELIKTGVNVSVVLGILAYLWDWVTK